MVNKWILPYLKKYRGWFVLVIFLGTLTSLFSSGLMFTSGYLISKAATQPESILMVYVPIVGVRTFAIGRAAGSYMERLTGHRFVLEILSSMRVRLYKLLEPQAVVLRSRFLKGDLLGVLADDIELLQNLYLKTIFPAIIALVVYTAIIVAAGSFSIPFAFLLALEIGILLFICPIFSLLYLRGKTEKIKRVKHRLYQQVTDAIFGISDLLFSRRHLTLIQEYEKGQAQMHRVEKDIHSFVNGRAVFNQLVIGVAVIVAIYWAEGMTLDGTIPKTFIAAFALVMLSVAEAFLPISEAVSDLSIYQDSIHRLRSLEDQDVQQGKEDEGHDRMDVSEVNIVLRGVCFQYTSESNLINHFSLHVTQGEKVAILGPSGAGKSTLLKLILGVLKPTSGEILFNERNARDVELSMPKMVSVLNQKPHLFHTSVMNNIRLGNPDASDEEVYWAAAQVQLDHVIHALPNGYGTNMDEAGQRFSGGERQRIALARILLQQTPVVIMDEPTVGLDPVTERNLLETIFETLKGKTIIWVTHHLAGMDQMDRIVFMDHGRMTMTGTHQELLEKEERYQRLYSLDHPFAISRKK